MILHVDMDAFYASVEERDRPELRGRPLIVGGTPAGRGVVAAANYVVRQFGVHSAMPTATALRLCPEAVVLPVRMSYYAEISRKIRSVFFRYTPLVEPLSLDEAFLDVTGSEGLFGEAAQVAQRIKREIHDETALVASVGVAPNKFLAKIASDLEKPDGLVVVSRGGVEQFLDPLPVGRLWGVGKVTESAFDQLGVRTIGQLRRVPLDTLKSRFGAQGERFWKLARGRDERRVVPDREAKSLSHETTFAADISDAEILRASLQDLAEQVGRRLRRQKHKGRTVHIKVRYADFRTVTRSRTLASATDTTYQIGKTAQGLLADALLAEHRGVRLLGVGVSSFADLRPVQQSLFAEEGDHGHAVQRHLDEVADAIREKFGAAALGRASAMVHHVGSASGSSPKRQERLRSKDEAVEDGERDARRRGPPGVPHS